MPGHRTAFWNPDFISPDFLLKNQVMHSQKVSIHIILFIVTFLSLTFKEYLLVALFTFNFSFLPEIFQQNWPYSATLIFILLCHEMGHYLPARYYGIKATLPYFIPFPLGPIGTMGAVIKIREQIPDKIKLFDIGAGGPLMSLLLSVAAWLYGVHLSELVTIDSLGDTGSYLYFGDSLFTYWSAQWLKGGFDTGIQDLMLHPLAMAGWVGLLVTAINLLPFGQLDGGHIIYAIFGESYRKWIHYLFLGFLLMSLTNFGWLIWGFIIFYLIKVEHPYIPDYTYPLTRGRVQLGIFLLVSFVFTFVPTPLIPGYEKNKNSLLEDIINWLNVFFS